MTSSLTKSRSAGYSDCIQRITDDGYQAAQEHAKDLLSKPRKSKEDIDYCAGFSDALRDTQALAPSDWPCQSTGRSI